MIRRDKRERIVWLMQTSGIEIGVSDVAYAMNGLAVQQMVSKNLIRCLVPWDGKWRYIIEHWALYEG